MSPAFLAVRKDDTIEFINRDNVYHELFSLSRGEPVQACLGKAGDHGGGSSVRGPGTGEDAAQLYRRLSNGGNDR